MGFCTACSYCYLEAVHVRHWFLESRPFSVHVTSFTRLNGVLTFIWTYPISMVISRSPALGASTNWSQMGSNLRKGPFSHGTKLWNSFPGEIGLPSIIVYPSFPGKIGLPSIYHLQINTFVLSVVPSLTDSHCSCFPIHVSTVVFNILFVLFVSACVCFSLLLVVVFCSPSWGL